MSTPDRYTEAPRLTDRTIDRELPRTLHRKSEHAREEALNLCAEHDRLRSNAAERRIDWSRAAKSACLSVVLVWASSHHALAIGSVCDSIKAKAAGKAAAKQLRCHSKEAKKGTVDDSCAEKAQAKLSATLAKAEGKLDCSVPGNGASLSSITDQFVSDVVSNGGISAQEVFVIEPLDDIAVVLPPPFPSFPLGIDVLSEPGIKNGVAVLTKVRNVGGEVIGFASELEEANLVTAISNTVWTLELPGRGALHLSQQEDLAPLLDIAFDMLATGDLERSFDPPLEFVDTIGAGVIVGGTGEFEHARGTFRELATLYGVSLIGERPLDARVVLEVDFE